MIYNDYLKKLSQAIKSRFDQISTHYNFDKGDEFEIALCSILREILPNKYGICRGHVVSKQGESAGDDIIIYDSFRLPTLRIFPNESFDRKQDIPIEAVYAYIEAKYTLHIHGKEKDYQSLLKASSQVSAVKKLCNQRDVRIEQEIHPYFRSNLPPSTRPDWPPYLNPVFGAIFSLQVRNTPGSKLLSTQEALHLLNKSSLGNQAFYPDLIIAGESNLILPCVTTHDNNSIIHAPFYIPKITTSIKVFPSHEIAFATGICFLLYALDSIQLGRMPWEEIINDGLKNNG
jgi:hypothetical protein